MSSGLFITLEGVEGSGKTTQAGLVADALRAHGYRVLVTREPGGTRAGETIRAIFLDPSVALQPEAELLLVLADRAQHVREQLRPALDGGAIVISDRYSDSTLAYQGYGRGLDLAMLTRLNDFATGGMHPDRTFVLDFEAEAGLARTRARMLGSERVPDRFEGQRTEFHRKVREGFLAIAHADPARLTVIDAGASIAEVTAAIVPQIEALVGTRCR
ncbi:MAG TPA: dTMP kinase [Candidatus Binataceae bacterium]|nr:dTMP kinase [Candidatus Binataceae bacterium]